MSTSQQKYLRHARNRKIQPIHWKKKKATKTACGNDKLSDFTEKAFQIRIIDMFKYEKEMRTFIDKQKLI